MLNFLLTVLCFSVPVTAYLFMAIWNLSRFESLGDGASTVLLLSTFASVGAVLRLGGYLLLGA